MSEPIRACDCYECGNVPQVGDWVVVVGDPVYSTSHPGGVGMGTYHEILSLSPYPGYVRFSPETHKNKNGAHASHFRLVRRGDVDIAITRRLTVKPN